MAVTETSLNVTVWTVIENCHLRVASLPQRWDHEASKVFYADSFRACVNYMHDNAPWDIEGPLVLQLLAEVCTGQRHLSEIHEHYGMEVQVKTECMHDAGFRAIIDCTWELRWYPDLTEAEYQEDLMASLEECKL